MNLLFQAANSEYDEPRTVCRVGVEYFKQVIDMHKECLLRYSDILCSVYAALQNVNCTEAKQLSCVLRKRCEVERRTQTAHQQRVGKHGSHRLCQPRHDALLSLQEEDASC